MNIYYCLVLVPIIFVVNLIFIKKKFLLNFSGEPHQKFASKNLTPLSGGFILITFLFLFLPKEIYNLLIFLLLFFILGISADNNFLKSPLSRMLIQLIIILALVVSFNLRVDDIRISYFNYFLQFEIINYIFLVFCLLILINGTNFIDGCNTLVLGYYILVTIFLLKLDLFVEIEINNFFIFNLLFTLSILYFFNLFGKLFLGDNGVYLISVIFGYFLINIYFNNNSISPYFIVLILWYPAFENLFSLIRKLIKRISPMLPDTNHFHQLLYFFLKDKFFKNNTVANSVAANLINFYNGMIFAVSINDISKTNLQLSLIILNIFVYLIIYVNLYKYKHSK